MFFSLSDTVFNTWWGFYSAALLRCSMQDAEGITTSWIGPSSGSAARQIVPVREITHARVARKPNGFRFTRDKFYELQLRLITITGAH